MSAFGCGLAAYVLFYLALFPLRHVGLRALARRQALHPQFRSGTKTRQA